jgi:hypothetical protein
MIRRMQPRHLSDFTAAARHSGFNRAAQVPHVAQSTLSLQAKHQLLIGTLPPGASFENNVRQTGFAASWEMDVFGEKRRAVLAAGAEVAALEVNRCNVLVGLPGEAAHMIP